LGRYREAVTAFEETHREMEEGFIRGSTGDPDLIPQILANLYGGWALAGIGQALVGLATADLKAFEDGGQAVITVLKAAQKAGYENAVLIEIDVNGQDVPPEVRPLMEELRIYVRLMSIEDPFEGWKALGEEISKVWPKGLSAVDAIREQRR
jgi:hypothetical protein